MAASGGSTVKCRNAFARRPIPVCRPRQRSAALAAGGRVFSGHRLPGEKTLRTKPEAEVSQAASFRDPAGSVSITEDRVLRTQKPERVANLQMWMESPGVRTFVDDGRAVATKQVAANPMLLEHPRIPFISYPWEWPAVMLHAAGMLTLDLAEAVIGEGLRLKDATPLNVLFRGAAPVFIDVLSMQEREPRDPIWWAAAQFTRTFLIPLLLFRRTGAPVHEIFLFHRDGLAPEDAVRRLPWLRRWLPPDLTLATLPSRAAKLESAELYRRREARDA